MKSKVIKCGNKTRIIKTTGFIFFLFGDWGWLTLLGGVLAGSKDSIDLYTLTHQVLKMRSTSNYPHVVKKIAQSTRLSLSFTKEPFCYCLHCTNPLPWVASQLPHLHSLFTCFLSSKRLIFLPSTLGPATAWASVVCPSQPEAHQQPGFSAPRTISSACLTLPSRNHAALEIRVLNLSP